MEDLVENKHHSPPPEMLEIGNSVPTLIMETKISSDDNNEEEKFTIKVLAPPDQPNSLASKREMKALRKEQSDANTSSKDQR